MTNGIRRTAGWRLLSVIAAVLTAGVAHGQDAANDAPPPLVGPPVAVVNVSGVDRALEDLKYLFGSVDRDDVAESVNELLGTVGDLRGLERGKSFGVLVYLRPGLVPQPDPIAFLPVADPTALARTVEMGPVVTKKVADDRYEIIGRDRTFYAKLADGYAFVASNEDSLNRELPAPSDDFAAITTRYDVAVEVRPESVPEGMRQLFLGMLRSNAQAELQQRNDEPDAAYALRKAQGLQNLQTVERLLTETRAVTLGLDVSSKSRKAVLELVFDAKPGSKFAEVLRSVAGEPSRFAALADADAPLSVFASLPVDEPNRKVLAELFNVGERQTALVLSRADGAAETGPTDADADVDPLAADVAGRVFDPLRATAAAGHVDGFVQFRGDQERKFVLLGGLKVLDAAAMEAPVRELIERVREQSPGAASAFEVQFGAADAAGVSLHRIAGRDSREQDRRLYGDAFAAHFGFGTDTVWFAVGGGSAVGALDDAVRQVREAAPADRGRGLAPFQVVVRANPWVGLDDQDAEGVELARRAFEDGTDAFRLDFRPTENGARLRAEAEEGFLKLLGLGVAKRFDERRRDEPEEGDQRREGDRDD